MHQQLWGYKVEWKSVSRGTGGKKVEYHCCSKTQKQNVRVCNGKCLLYTRPHLDRPGQIGIDEANWILLAQDIVRWRTFVSTVVNLWVQ